MSTATHRLIEIQQEKDRRDREMLRVYRPSETQEPIHRSEASELIVRGGKRAGKSVAVSAAFGSRVTGQPIIAKDGTEIPNPWPAPSPDYPRIYWIIGWSTDHIGQTIYRLLFEPGQGGSYRVIQDEVTGKWRTWNRADAGDVARVKESKLAEPLIPRRLLDSPTGNWEDAFAWEDKKAKHFSSVRLNNGATIFAYPSSARNPKQGDAVSGIWIDEDIQFPGHLKEWQDRLTDEEGWFMWSVWPHNKNEALLDLLSRAEMAEMEEKPQIQSVQLVMTENPFLSDKGKSESLGRMESDEEIARRNRGDLLTDALSMYQFSPSVHQIQRPLPGAITHYVLPEAHAMLRDMWVQTGTFPRDWTRYLSIDPSNTRTAVHSWVVPPKEYQGTEIGNLAICEWELIARRFNAKLLADSLAPRMGTLNYEAFIMDQRAGRQTHAGREETTFLHYSAAFRQAKLLSRQTSYSFLPGCDVRQTRFRAVRELLDVQPETMMPGFLFVEERCVETKREFAKYRKKTENRGEGMDSVLDEPASPRLFDAMACHDSETQVLTRSGWKHFADVALSDPLATVDLASDTIEYQLPTAIHQSNYSGDMIHFAGMKNDAMVTPNHRMVVFGYGKGEKGGGDFPGFVEASEISRWSSLKVAASNWSGQPDNGPVLIPRVAGGHTGEVEVDRTLMARLLGWYVSEGCTESVPKCPGVGYRVTLSQKKSKGVKEIGELLDALPWKWYRNGSNFTVHNKQLWTYLQECGSGFKSKRVPQWIKDADVATISQFVSAAMSGDGNVQFGRRNYYTSSPRLADDMQELFLKMGVGASLHLRKPVNGILRGREVKSTCPHFRILQRDRHVASLANHDGESNFKTVHYTGTIHCATVPNSTLITRRNGRVLVSGNSVEYFAAYIEPMFMVGQAYVDPSMYASRINNALRYAKKLLQKRQQGESEVVHLGAGSYD